MKFKYLLPAILSLIMISCSQIVDNIVDQKVKDSYVSPYKGTYAGTYSGDDSGTLVLTVSDKNDATIEKSSSKFGKTETFYGGLSGPAFTVADRGFGFKGNLISQSGIFTGTWSQNGLGGSWTLKKQ